MEAMLRWRLVAPTAPDTLWCYPFQDGDQFVLKECPHVFLVGNLPSYTTPDGRIIGGVDNRYVAGTLVSTNTGNADAGTQRIVTAATSPEVLNQTNGNLSAALSSLTLSISISTSSGPYVD